MMRTNRILMMITRRMILRLHTERIDAQDGPVNDPPVVVILVDVVVVGVVVERYDNNRTCFVMFVTFLVIPT